MVTANATGKGGIPQYSLNSDSSAIVVTTENPVTHSDLLTPAKWTIQAVGPGTAMISASVNYETRTCQDGNCFFYFRGVSSPSVSVAVVAPAAYLLQVASVPLEGGDVMGAGSYADGETVSVTATAAAGWTFGGWFGDCTGAGPCDLTMDDNKSVTATFSQEQDTSGLGRIAFESTRDGNSEIYVMAADGSGQLRLTFDPAPDLYPDWSPDAEKIVFASGDSSIIVVMKDNGADRNPLTAVPEFVDDIQPAWSLDGALDQIAFASNIEGGWNIWVMNDDGADRTQRTFIHTEVDAHPSWSPDGEQIVLGSTVDDNSDIYPMNADGSGRTRLTFHSSIDRLPAWSPDGTLIAFVSDRDGDDEIWVMEKDGSNQTQLTHNSDSNPDWSPDGKQIAFDSDRNGDREIYVMTFAGSDQAQRTSTPGENSDPSWAPPSTAVAETFTLTIHCDGDLPGIVTPQDCETSQEYPAGTVVTLTAAAAEGDALVIAWDGACFGNVTCVVTMDADKGAIVFINGSALIIAVRGPGPGLPALKAAAPSPITARQPK